MEHIKTITGCYIFNDNGFTRFSIPKSLHSPNDFYYGNFTEFLSLFQTTKFWDDNFRFLNRYQFKDCLHWRRTAVCKRKYIEENSILSKSGYSYLCISDVPFDIIKKSLPQVEEEYQRRKAKREEERQREEEEYQRWRVKAEAKRQKEEQEYKEWGQQYLHRLKGAYTLLRAEYSFPTKLDIKDTIVFGDIKPGKYFLYVSLKDGEFNLRTRASRSAAMKEIASVEIVRSKTKSVNAISEAIRTYRRENYNCYTIVCSIYGKDVVDKFEPMAKEQNPHYSCAPCKKMYDRNVIEYNTKKSQKLVA